MKQSSDAPAAGALLRRFRGAGPSGCAVGAVGLTVATADMIACVVKYRYDSCLPDPETDFVNSPPLGSSWNARFAGDTLYS